MPLISRPDGVELYWEERGEGPNVVIANQFFAPLAVFDGLLDLLVLHHRVVAYDMRGIGSSSRQGPYDMDTDVDDLAAVIEATCDGPVVIATMGDGANRAVRMGASRPDLVRAVVCVASNPVNRAAGQGGDGLAASDSVMEALQAMMETDYRGALRTMISTANPDLEDEAVRSRVAASAEWCPQEAAAPRMRAWVADEAVENSRALGDRLWILEEETNPWFMETVKRTAELLPDAHVYSTEAGAVSRPDISASCISAITGVGDEAAARSGVTER